MDKIKEIIYKYRVLVVIICLVLICGCGYVIYNSFFNDDLNYVTSVSDGDETVLENDSVTITKDDLYEYFLSNDGMNLTLDYAIDYVTDKEITNQDDIDAKVDELKKQYTDYINSDLDSYAKENGYEDEQSFIDEMILPSAKKTLLQEKYIDKNYDKLVKSYKIKYIKTITLDTESQALKIIKDSKDEESFNNYMTENNGSDLGLVTKESSSVDENIVKKLNKFTKDGVYSKVIKTSDSKYAVIWVYNTDKSKLKDEIKESLSQMSDISQESETYYLKKYNFDVFEPNIKKQIEEVSEDYFG